MLPHEVALHQTGHVIATVAGPPSSSGEVAHAGQSLHSGCSASHVRLVHQGAQTGPGSTQ